MGTVYAGVGDWPGAAQGARTHGFFRLSGDDDAWQPISSGLPENAEVRSVVIRPDNPEIVYAGTQMGPYRSDDAGRSWTSLRLPGPNRVVWSICLHPIEPETIFVGVGGFSIWRTRDGGASWQELAVPAPGGGIAMPFPTRVVRIVIDPNNPDEIYAGLEVSGIVRSLDGGDTWSDISGDLLALATHERLHSALVSGDPNEGMMDTHALAISRGHPGTVLLANRMGLFRSHDKGARWAEIGIGRFSELTYARDVQASPHDPECLYAALSIAAGQRRRQPLPQPRLRRDLAALRRPPADQQHADDPGPEPERPRSDLVRRPARPGLRHRGRRRDLAPGAAAGRSRGDLRARLQLSRPRTAPDQPPGPLNPST